MMKKIVSSVVNSAWRRTVESLRKASCAGKETETTSAWRKVAVAVMCVVGMGASAQPAVDYYTGTALDGKNGRELELAVAGIVYPHTRISYDNLWEKFPITDPGPTDSIPADAPYSDLVYDMYAWMQMRPHYYSDGDHSQATGINREHSLPNSWWGGKEGNTEAYSDLHHLVPSDGAANNKKSNYPLGSGAEIAGSTATNTTNSGCKLWKLPTAEQVNYGGAAALWEPTDEYKGDFARMYLYVVCTYEQKLTWKTTYMFESDAENNTTIKPWAQELLLKWHRQDRVSDKERARNNAVEGIQGNRNPFIDYPELVEYIWGDKNTEGFSLEDALSAYSNAYINGFITLNIGSTGYATLYYGTKNLIVPEGVSAWTFTGDASDMTLTATLSYDEGDIIPADEAVLLYTTEPGIYNFECSPTAGAKVAENHLRGTDETMDVVAGANETFYYLANGSHGVGFYKAYPDGSNTHTNGAHKAYLVFTAPSYMAPAHISLPMSEGGTTGLCGLTYDISEEEAPMYDILGRRVDSSYRGFVIKNGRKYFNQ